MTPAAPASARSPEPAPAKRRHLLIAGSGRAGTSFLVRYLTEAGLDTHLTRHGHTAWFDQAANAGLEDLPLSRLNANLPYVIKSPWTYEFIDEVLADPLIELDAVILPMRDLAEAAASRVVLELRAIHESSPEMAQLDRPWGHHGRTPGGLVYSLDPVDQARILAVGFHHLLERLVRNDVPVRLVSFPRLIADSDYLYNQLFAWLPQGLDPERAREVHARIAESRKVRVGGELAAAQAGARTGFLGSAPSVADLDRIALAREIERLRGRLTELDAARADALASASDLERAEAHAWQEAAAAREANLLAEVARLQALAGERLQALDATRRSTSWRLTAPLRAFSRLLGPARDAAHA